MPNFSDQFLTKSHERIYNEALGDGESLMERLNATTETTDLQAFENSLTRAEQEAFDLLSTVRDILGFTRAEIRSRALKLARESKPNPA